jgi:4-amino-4-deoxy-L-arabinose transferase-like glycosyltransferase
LHVAADSVTISYMPPNPSPSRSIKSLLVIGLLTLALIVAAIVAFMMYSSQQDYKNNADQKIAAAVKVAETAQAAKLQQEFAEASKSPFKTYKGSVTYGTVTFAYPRTWSVYGAQPSSDTPIDLYLHPDQVPALDNDAALYALRVEMVDTEYSDVLEEFSASISDGTVKARAIVPPKMKNVTNVQPGMRLDGAIAADQQGSMVILRLRDKTLKLYTESADFRADFEKVLASLTFVP